MSGQLTFEDRDRGKEKSAAAHNYDAARDDLWLRPEAVLDQEVNRRIGDPSMREFTDNYVHIGDLLRMVGTYAGQEFRRGTVVRFDHDDRPVIEHEGTTITVDRFKILKVKKGAGLDQYDTLRYAPYNADTKAVKFLRFDGWPWMRVKWGLGAMTVSLLDVDRVILPDEPGEKGAPYGTPSDYEWAVGNTVKPATRVSPFDIKSVGWSDYGGQRRPQYITSSFHPEWRRAWCDVLLDRWRPVLML